MPEQLELGRRTWAFAAGFLPDGGTGPEPEMTSRDELCFLNTGEADAVAEVTIYHVDDDPVGPYRVTVPARRVRHARVNGFVDPLPVPLGRPYAVVVHSDRPLVTQLRHVDTRQAPLAVALSTGYPGNG